MNKRKATSEFLDDLRLIIRYPGSFSALVGSLIFLIPKQIKSGSIATKILYIELKIIFISIIYLVLPYYRNRNKTEEDISSISPRYLINIFFISYFISLVIFLLVPALIALAEGRFYSADPVFNSDGVNIFNFLDDWFHLLQFGFVYPTAVGLGIVLIYLSRDYLNRNDPPFHSTIEGMETLPPDTRPRFFGTLAHLIPLVLLVAIYTFLLSAAFHSNLLFVLTEDVNRFFALNAAKLAFYEMEPGPIIYWFLGMRNGLPHFNISGYFYLLTNNVMQFISVFGSLVFFSMAAFIIQLTKTIQTDRFMSYEKFSKLNNRYILAFIITKWIMALSCVNIFIWKSSILGMISNANLDLIILHSVLIGGFMLAIPNRIVEISLYTRERLHYSKKIECNPENSATLDKPQFKSIVPLGWPMIIKNTANWIIGLVYVKTVGIPTMIDVYLRSMP